MLREKHSIPLTAFDAARRKSYMHYHVRPRPRPVGVLSTCVHVRPFFAAARCAEYIFKC